MDLQSALQRIAPHITPPAPETPPRPVKRATKRQGVPPAPVAPETPPRPAKRARKITKVGPRLVARGTFDCGRKAGPDTTGEFNRPDLSEPTVSLTFKWSPT